MCLDVSTGGELHVALAAGVPAERLVLHGNNKSERRAGRARSAVGVGRSSSTPSTRSTGSARLLESLAGAGPSAQGAGPGHARGRGPHPRVRPHRPGGLQVRVLGLRPGAAAEAVAALRALPGVELVGVHAHIGSQVFAPRSFEQAVEVLAAFFAPLGLPELVRRRWPRCGLRRTARRRRHRRVGRTVHEPPARGPASTRRRGSPPSPGARSWPRRRSRSTRWGRSRSSRASAPTSRRRRDERQPPPVLYGSGYEAFLPRDVGAPTAPAGPGRGQALRVRRRRRGRGPSCPTTWRWATSWPPRSPAPTATRWPRTTTRCPGRRWSSSPTARPGSSCGARPFDDLLRLDV